MGVTRMVFLYDSLVGGIDDEPGSSNDIRQPPRGWDLFEEAFRDPLPDPLPTIEEDEPEELGSEETSSGTASELE